MYRKCVEMRVVLVVCRPGVRPWSLHGLSIEFPSNFHGLSMEETSTPQRRGPLHIYQMLGIRGLSLRSESLKHQIKERIEDGGYPARSTAEGVGGII